VAAAVCVCVHVHVCVCYCALQRQVPQQYIQQVRCSSSGWGSTTSSAHTACARRVQCANAEWRVGLRGAPLVHRLHACACLLLSTKQVALHAADALPH
jgi:hypothetical protein